MRKSRQIKVMIPDNPSTQDFPNEDTLNDQVKFDLYRKEQEIRQISQILRDIASRGKNEQRQWLQDNEDLMFDLAEDYVEDSLYKLDGAEMNHETLELSVQVMADLRKTLNLFQTVLSNDDELEA